MLGDIDLDRTYIDLAFDAHGDVVGIIGNPHGECVGVFEDAVYDQFGFDFDASNFAEIGFDHLFAFICDREAVHLVVDVNINGVLFARSGIGIIEVSEVVNGRGDILGILRDGEFALFVAQFAVVVIVNRHVLMEVIVFSHGFGVAKGGLRFLIHPTFEFIAHFIGPVEAFYGFTFHAEVVSSFAVDDGWGITYGHRYHAGIDCAVMDAVFEGFTGLVGEVVDFSAENHSGGLLECGQGG